MKKILYIDDEDINLKLFKLNFGNTYDVVTLLSPLDALKKLETEKFKVIVTDYKMPILNGMELIDKIKSDHPDINCIILSAYLESDVVTDKTKVFKYIMKPYKKDDVMRCLEEAFNR
jgi:CheY-like chemotaxis protein